MRYLNNDFWPHIRISGDINNILEIFVKFTGRIGFAHFSVYQENRKAYNGKTF